MPTPTIYIDADGTPKSVRDWTIKTSSTYHLVCWTVSNYNHEIQGDRHLTVDSGADSVDLKIFSLIKQGDLVITQDYGLAGLVISKRGDVITPHGLRIDRDNIDYLLTIRAEHRRLRLGGVRMKGPKKRRSSDDRRFQETFFNWLRDLRGLPSHFIP